MKLVDALSIGAAATQIRWLGERARADLNRRDMLCPAVRDYLAKLEAAKEVLDAEVDRLIRLGERSDLLPAPPDPFEPDEGEQFAADPYAGARPFGRPQLLIVTGAEDYTAEAGQE